MHDGKDHSSLPSLCRLFAPSLGHQSMWHYDACLSRLAPRPHRLHTTNGGVYEPFAVPVARYYPITTVQHPVTGGSSGAFGSQKLTGAPGAASSKRQPQSATNWIQHRVNTA
ncbi:hypothetical protein AAEP93_011105 [Penicillium crustosum]